MSLLSVHQTAEKFNVSERRVQKLCEDGRIDGAQMVSNVWVIPETVEKPIDGRITQLDEDKVSLNQLCKELSISVATGRNWVKLGKITPAGKVKRIPFFTKDYIAELINDIQKDGTTLKRRRNKKHALGNVAYRSYVSSQSKNLLTLQYIFDIIKDNEIKVTRELLIALIADCAFQLLEAKITNNSNKVCHLAEYLNNCHKGEDKFFLIEDIICGITPRALTDMLGAYPQLFNVSYVYEENEDIIGLLYISLRDISDRKTAGAYYTPTEIVKKLCNQLFSMNCYYNKTILDPCCGTGNFILQLPQDIDYNMVYGNDIDTLSVQIARVNYALKYNIFDKKIVYEHITKNNYFLFPTTKKYDFIIGNPPWGYEFTEMDKAYLKFKYISATGTNIESYDVVIEQALKNLKNGGVISFVLPEAFLNVKAHAPIRTLVVKNNSIRYLEFLGNVFDKVMCPSVIVQFVHDDKPFHTKGMLVVKDTTTKFVIKTDRLVSASNFDFSMSDDAYSIINKLDGIKNKVTLENKAIFALGIVTGDNKKYISAKKNAFNETILRGADINKFKIIAKNSYITFQPNMFQQSAPVKYYRAKEKLLYRFISSQLVFAYDNHQTLSLNSCNILLPRIDGLDIKYVMAILNSRIAQFYFENKFHSVKVLRSHIEKIPIPYLARDEQRSFIDYVDNILGTTNNQNTMRLYNILDEKIAQLYALDREEYDYLKLSVDEHNLFLLQLE